MSPEKILFEDDEQIKTVSPKYVPAIESIATGNPEDYIIEQVEAAQFVIKHCFLEQHQHKIEQLYKNTQIKYRKLAFNILTQETVAFSQQRGNIEVRMKLFEELGLPLAEKVAKEAISNLAQRNNSSFQEVADSIGLIVFVTSTGFLAPGIDTKLIKRLGLKRDISRIPVHFMGCAAAMNGLRVASNHVKANPQEKALVICLELSSVNAVFEDNINDVIIHSIFGDGCGAVVIGAYDCAELNLLPRNEQPLLRIQDHFSYLAEDTEDGITLGIRDNGITCVLSKNLPDYIESSLCPIVDRFLAHHGLTKEDIDLWAVHPGGTRIIQKAQVSLGLRDDQVTYSWKILREYGNMLSCSILFVLELMIEELKEPVTKNLSQNFSLINHPTPFNNRLQGLAFSFSPGIGVEGILFEKV